MNLKLDPLLHQPIRTRIMTFLHRNGAIDFSTLKKNLGLSDGHMSTHLKTLITAGYLEMKKEFVEGKPKTIYETSLAGKNAFRVYLDELKKLSGL